MERPREARGWFKRKNHIGDKPVVPVHVLDDYPGLLAEHKPGRCLLRLRAERLAFLRGVPFRYRASASACFWSTRGNRSCWEQKSLQNDECLQPLPDCSR